MVMENEDAKVYKKAFVRISSNGKAIGAGILLGEVGDKSKLYILTCAHVVNAALDKESPTLDPDPSKTTSDPIPNRSISIEFPELGPGKKLEAQVKWWRKSEKYPPEPGKDIAILEILDNQDYFSRDQISPLKLKEARDLDLVNHSVSFRGFPEEVSSNLFPMPSEGKLGNLVAGLIEIESLEEQGAIFRPQKGFSGAPVWDNNIHQVVGIFTAVYTTRSISWMIPNEVITSSIPSQYKKLLFESTPPKTINGSEKTAKGKVTEIDKIIDELKLGNVVPVLGPGINPLIYIDLANRLIEKVGREIQNDEEWNTTDEDNKKRLRQKLIGEVIGLPCSACHQLTGYRPANCPIVGHIVAPQNKQAEILYIEQELVVAKMNLRYFSQAFQVDKSPQVFYEKLRQLSEMDVMFMPGFDLEKLRDYLSQIAQGMKLENTVKTIKGKDFNPLQIHRFFAKFPKLMPMIITTNYDNWLERAFSVYNSEQPFDVFFYDNSLGGNRKENKEDKKFENFVHKSSEGRLSLASQETNLEKLFERKGLRQRISAKQPIILKLFGDWNFADDGCQFAINEYQFNSSLRCLKDLPTDLKTFLKHKDKRLLFIGFSPNDYELQLLVNRLREDEMIKTSSAAGKSWLIHQGETGKLAESLWEKREVTLVSTSSLEDFISQLKTGI